MEFELDPTPTPRERQAIEAALRRLIGRGTQPAAYTSAWRKTGVRESVERYAGARPRNSFGATRA